jgi:rubredoxin
MLDEARDSKVRRTAIGATTGDFVEFATAGVHATGEYHCSGCGYGVTINAMLPQCPMCAGTTWERVPWSPFSRAARLQ